jgi:hypothetical protein
MIASGYTVDSIQDHGVGANCISTLPPAQTIGYSPLTNRDVRPTEFATSKVVAAVAIKGWIQGPTSTASSTVNTSHSASQGISGGIIAGIVLGSLAVFSLLIWLCVFMFLRQRKAAQSAEDPPAHTQTTTIYDAVPGNPGESNVFPRYELPADQQTFLFTD